MKFFFWAVACLPVGLRALPTGETVERGTVVFTTPQPGVLEITASSGAIINYGSFNIGQTEKVEFVLPNSQSTILNRVEGIDPSSILGQLVGNGRIFLLNPYGIYFGPAAEVNVGSLIASTLAIHSENFAQNAFRFFHPRPSEHASIVNEGILSASAEGAIILLAPVVQNEGEIMASTGSVVLSSAERITLDFSGDGLISFVVEGELSSSSCCKIKCALQDASTLIRSVVNDEGCCPACSIVEDGGVVRLTSSSQITSERVLVHSPKVHIEGEVSGFVDVLSEKGIVVVGPLTSDDNLFITGDHVVLNADISVNDLMIVATCSIQNGESQAIVTTEANQIYNVLKGSIGNRFSPIEVHAGMLVFAGTPCKSAVFSGTTADDTIHPIPGNQPFPLIFNGESLLCCSTPSHHKHNPIIPAHYWYVQGIYSQYDSLASDIYFLPEVITADYVNPRNIPLFIARRNYSWLMPARTVDRFIDKPSNRGGTL